MSDFVVDFSGLEDNDYDLIPKGWYKFVITKWSEDINGNPIVVRNADGKLPKGTTGTNWEFTADGNEKYDGRKLWTTYWHHMKTAGFWKALYAASGMFTEFELLEPMDLLAERDRVLGAEVWIQVGIKPKSGDYEAQNTIRRIAHIESRSGGTTKSNPLAP